MASQRLAAQHGISIGVKKPLSFPLEGAPALLVSFYREFLPCFEALENLLADVLGNCFLPLYVLVLGVEADEQKQRFDLLVAQQ